MTRQFFVGGNFKLNPVTLESKKSLISGLNKAELDPSTGAYNASPFLISDTKIVRGRYRTALNLPDPGQGSRSQGYQSGSAKLLLQRIWSIHWRDQVCYDIFVLIFFDFIHLALSSL